MGDRIAFAHHELGESVELGVSSIWVMDAFDGGNRENLSGEDASDSLPAWRPDGEWIAFVSSEDGVSGLFVMEANNGEGRRQVVGPVRGGSRPAWSPNGEKLAFTNTEGGIAVIRRDGAEYRALTEGPRHSNPSWSPDGRYIVFESSTLFWEGEALMVFAARRRMVNACNRIRDGSVRHRERRERPALAAGREREKPRLVAGGGSGARQPRGVAGRSSLGVDRAPLKGAERAMSGPPAVRELGWV